MSQSVARWPPEPLAPYSLSLRPPAPAHPFSHSVHQPKKDFWFFNPPSLPLPVIWLRFNSSPLRTLKPFLGFPRLSYCSLPEALTTLCPHLFYPGLVNV